MKWLISILCWLSLGFAITGYTAIDVYEFVHPQQEEQFRSVINELRCPKCQNQSIADSDAELARDIKQRVHQQVIAGRSNDEIVAFMVERYGDFVTYRPPLRVDTLLLWFGPFVVVFLALLVLLVRFVRRHRPDQPPALTPEEQARLARLLDKSSDRSR